MKNSSETPSATSTDPQSFKAQLKKLSDKSINAKTSKAGNTADALAENHKNAEAKPLAAKPKRMPGDAEQDSTNENTHSDASQSQLADLSSKLWATNKASVAQDGEGTASTSQGVQIASLSLYELHDNAKTSNTSFESQADTIVAQASYATPVSTSYASSAVASATPSFSLLGLGAGVGALALVGSKGGSSASSGGQTSATAATPTSGASTTLTGLIAAGPMINTSGLKVDAFDASGKLLASTANIQTDGTYSIDLKSPYTGVVKLVVSDTNGSTPNYIDEATAQPIDFGSKQLITIFDIPAGKTNFSLNINTITTDIASRVAKGVNEDLTQVTELKIAQALTDFANAFQIKDTSQLDTLLTDKPSLLLKSDGTVNSTFDGYGLLLAIKSMMDSNSAYQVKDALKALTSSSTYSQKWLAATSALPSPAPDWSGVIDKLTADIFNLPASATPLTATQLGAVQTFAAGDLNGDGISDWLFTFKGGDVNKGGLLGKAYAMYGNTSGNFDLSGPASGASTNNLIFTLDKSLAGEIAPFPEQHTRVGFLPIIAGDSNGNGLGEIAFSTQRTPVVPQVHQSNYVDFTEGTTSNLRMVSTNKDQTTFAMGYNSLASGDINGDGFSDFYFEDPQGNPAGLPPVVHVMWGNKSLTGIKTDVEISSNPNGCRISDSKLDTNLAFGWGVSYVADTNGDGYGDIVVPESYRAVPSTPTQEKVFVVFGGAQLSDLDLATIENANGASKLGYVIYGDANAPFLAFGAQLNTGSIAGDFNGDGLNDFIFEGQKYDHSVAKFYVVLGKQNSSNIHLDALGSQGFTIALPSIALSNVINVDNDMARDVVTNCGDKNGDGLDDILITLTFNTSIAGDSANKTNHFLAYVVFGKTNLDNIDLGNLGNNGYQLANYSKTLPIASPFFGSITAPGDINGDGISDLIQDDYSGDNGLLPTVLLGSASDPLLASAQNKFTFQGTSGNDPINLKTSNVSETLVGGAGDDAIYGNGGADVMYGGAGNDVFYVNQDNISQLSQGVAASGRFARIDGGGGVDTLSLDGTGITLDLTQIANTRLQSIEKINLGTGNTLKVSWKDIQNMSAMNLFNKSTGWTGADFDTNATIPFHQLVVDGQSLDTVNLIDGGWTKTSALVMNANQSYDAYVSANHAVQLLIKTGISTAIL